MPRDQAPTQAPKKQGLQPDEQKFYGVHACQALFQRRPDDIVRVYLTEDRMKAFGPLLKQCARDRKAYHIVTPEDMERIAASVHHEGIVILAKKPERWNDRRLIAHAEKVMADKDGRDALLYLDGVQNPHNVGAILRLAAHFGASAVCGRTQELPALAPSSYRVAEGGAEHVPLCELGAAEGTLRDLKRLGYKLLTTSSHAGESLFAKPMPRYVVLVLGGEVSGITKKLESLSDGALTIPGTGNVESLNVAGAASILLAEFWRGGVKK